MCIYVYVIVCTIYTAITELVLFEERENLRKKSAIYISHSTFYYNKLKSVILEINKNDSKCITSFPENKLEIDSVHKRVCVCVWLNIKMYKNIQLIKKGYEDFHFTIEMYSHFHKEM